MVITLALGGGGIRGLAHIGVLRVLEREGFVIHSIAGTSAGGLIGAIYAAGKSPDEMQAIITNLDQKKLFGRSKTDGPSLLGLSGLINLLTEVVGTKTFDDLRLPFACTAVDTISGQEVILHLGSVLQAVTATVAVPGVFPPVRIENTYLIDGGILDPVPVRPARWLAPHLPVVAVVLNPAAPRTMLEPAMPIPIPGPQPLVEQFAKFRLAQAFNIFLRSNEISGLATTELRLKVEKPDIIIRPMLAGIGLLDRVDPIKVIAAGEHAAEEVLPQLRKAVGLPAAISRRTLQVLKPKPAVTFRHNLR